MTMRRAGWLLLIGCLVALPHEGETHQIDLVAERVSHEARDAFRCGERVWLDIHWAELPPGPHQVQARWMRPDGVVQEEAAYAFTAADDETYFWLMVEPPGLWWGPSAELVSGTWSVRISLDDRPLGTRRFRLTC